MCVVVWRRWLCVGTVVYRSDFFRRCVMSSYLIYLCCGLCGREFRGLGIVIGFVGLRLRYRLW